MSGDHPWAAANLRTRLVRLRRAPLFVLFVNSKSVLMKAYVCRARRS